MSEANPTNTKSSEKEAIRRLIRRGWEEGRCDIFLAKRRWFRYKLGLRLDVTTNPDDPDASWACIMHNVSGGGVGFWSRRELTSDSVVFIREYSADNRGEWIQVRVSHCTVGIQGYLIGASFELQLPPDSGSGEFRGSADPASEVFNSDEFPNMISTRPFLPSRSLRIKCACASIVASCMGMVAAALQFNCPMLVVGPIWTNVLAIMSAVCLGAIGGWIIVGGEIRFVEGMMSVIGSIIRGDTDPGPLPEEPSKELGELRKAFISMEAVRRKREESERVRREKLEDLNQIKNNILSIVSHDLRTPLTSILLYARMLADELGTLAEQDQRRFLNIISDECNRLSNLVDDLLEVQRLETGRIKWDMQPKDLSETIHSCANLFEAMAKSKSITLTADCPETLPAVEADPERISQALSNLISNAVKYTQRGGAIRVWAEAAGKDILIHVADNGLGIPRDKWDQIFDRFTQLSDPNRSQIKGVGLGLYIVKRIVEHHNGSVWVDSEVGRGSEFVVSLPMQAEPRPALVHEPTSLAKRVVVCDADPELAARVAQMLRGENLEVRVVHSACRLLAQLAEAEPDVVITDVLLPDMDAQELLNAIQNLPKRSFRLIVHSYAGSSTHLKRQGVDIFLKRPTSANELIQAVRVALLKESNAGMTLLMIGYSDRLDLKQFNQLLSDGGHMPIFTETVAAASALIEDYPIDTILVLQEALDEDWSDLKHLKIEGRSDILITVVCDRVSKKERRLAEIHQVIAVPFDAGGEEELLAAVTASQQSLVEEVCR
jgi:signal transduction histidine kinase/CheY-like chemotaxis protein